MLCLLCLLSLQDLENLDSVREFAAAQSKALTTSKQRLAVLVCAQGRATGGPSGSRHPGSLMTSSRPGVAGWVSTGVHGVCMQVNNAGVMGVPNAPDGSDGHIKVGGRPAGLSACLSYTSSIQFSGNNRAPFSTL
jgi:hypothetical protein